MITIEDRLPAFDLLFGAQAEQEESDEVDPELLKTTKNRHPPGERAALRGRGGRRGVRQRLRHHTFKPPLLRKGSSSAVGEAVREHPDLVQK